MFRRFKAGLAAAAAVLAASCATASLKSREALLDDTLRAYASTIRWGDVDQAQAFVDPKRRSEHPLTSLELARFKQVRVTGYDEQPVAADSEEQVRQTVRIDLVNVNTQAARSIVDHQVWHYDAEQKRWWLVSGLPDITRSQ